MSDVLRVLIVEDEALLLMQMEALLEEEGHIVVATAMSSEEAIQLAELMRPDLAFVDVHLLDGPTGVDVARHLCAAATTNVVFMTANAKRLPEDFAGAMGVIAKPCSQAGIAATVRYLSECVRRFPPRSTRPPEFTVSPALCERLRAAAE